jgi:hypothetical protein
MQRPAARDTLADVIFEQGNARGRQRTGQVSGNQALKIGAPPDLINLDALGAFRQISRIEDLTEHAASGIANRLLSRFFGAHFCEDLI